MKVDMVYTPKCQFDQGGLLLFVSEDHWMKCGIEFCDGLPRLSVVVCNMFSDWSTQPWGSHGVRLRVHKVHQSSSLVVEAAVMGTEDYQFIRIAHLSTTNQHTSGADCDAASSDNTTLPWLIGPFAACPIQQKGCEAVFSNFSIGPRLASCHSSTLDL